MEDDQILSCENCSSRGKLCDHGSAVEPGCLQNSYSQFSDLSQPDPKSEYQDALQKTVAVQTVGVREPRFTYPEAQRNWLDERFMPVSDGLNNDCPYLRLIYSDYSWLQHDPPTSGTSLIERKEPCRDSKGDVDRQQLQNFREEIKTVRIDFNFSFLASSSRNGSYVKDNVCNYPLRLGCDGCESLLATTDRTFHCNICNGGNFDLCEKCVDSKRHCKEPRHRLIVIEKRIVLFAAIVNIYAHPPWRFGIPTSAPDTPCHTVRPPSESLDEVLECYLGTLGHRALAFHKGLATPDTKAREFGVTYLNPLVRAMVQWSRICIVLEDKDLDPPFRSFLGPTQIESIRLLQEWLLGEIQDFRLSCMGLHGAFIESLFPGTPSEIVNTITGTGYSAYHRNLCSLFIFEFMRGIPPAAVRNTRNSASRAACAQRAGFLLHHGSLQPKWFDPKADVFLAGGNLLSNMVATCVAPIVLCRTKDEAQSNLYREAFGIVAASSVRLSINNHQNAEQVLGTNKIETSTEPCPWLPEKDIRGTIPFYLWDRKRRETVRTNDLGYNPSYTTISHTWGRWRVRDEPAVIVPGVPWKVPPNTRFSVQEIANILEKVPGGNRFIWFDLVCIPQVFDDDEANKKELERLQKQEIARQASIFRNATLAIAWFNDLHSFGELENVTRYLAIQSYYPLGQWEQRLDVFRNVERDLSQSSHNGALFRTELPEGTAHDYAWFEVIHEWFTSLWTLQEACMRPDMWLCTADWKPAMAVGLSEPLTLGVLLALGPEAEMDPLRGHQGSVSSSIRIRKRPQVVETFRRHMVLSRMVDLPGISPIGIVCLGNQRFCEGRRAEAIMAVLGATDWYTSAVDDSSREKDLVLGRYPLSFVTEVRHKVKDHIFFNTLATQNYWELLIKDDLTEQELISSTNNRGTLLPFGASATYKHYATHPHTLESISTSQPHESLSTWKIEPSGSVVIESAGIVASRSGYELPGTFDKTTEDAKVFDMQEFMLERKEPERPKAFQLQNLWAWICSRSYPCYAVCVTVLSMKTLQGLVFSTAGVLLRELSNGKFVKCGAFETFWNESLEAVKPPAQDVAWKVI